MAIRLLGCCRQSSKLFSISIPIPNANHLTNPNPNPNSDPTIQQPARQFDILLTVTSLVAGSFGLLYTPRVVTGTQNAIL